MKQLIIFRHGEYDCGGQLTESGIQDVFCRAKLLPRSPELILTSPLIRAQQTALAVALALGNPPVETEDLLAENMAGQADICRQAIIAVAEEKRVDVVAVVTHFPNIRALVGISLAVGFETILEAESWDRIFDVRPVNLFHRLVGKVDNAELATQYFMPHCSEKDWAELRKLPFWRHGS